MNEINRALDILIQNGVSKENITVLHCNTQYPTPMEDVNLKAMLSIRNEFDIKVGYSDHTLGIEIPIAAAALGAVIIEKHFTLDNQLPGPDHKASLNPKDLKRMITSIRNLEAAMGNGQKIPSKSELENLRVVRKSIHLENDLKKGEVIKKSDLKMMRPGDGISPMDINLILGKKTLKKLFKGHKLSNQDLE